MKKLMTKLMAVSLMALLNMWSAEAQNVEIGFGATIAWPAVATANVNTTFNTGNTEFTITSSAGQVKSATVCNTSSVPHYELGGTAHLLEGLLTSNSATSKITFIRFKGSTNGSAAAAGVVFSSASPFDVNATVGAISVSFPASSGGWANLDIASGVIPTNAKSFRIYRRVYYNSTTSVSQTGSSTGFVQYGDGTTIRLAYVGVTVSAGVPSITSFTAAGVDATINESAKTITAELPYGTNLTAITPTVTIGGTATSYTPAGAQDFSAGAVTYTATDGSNPVNYAVTLTASLTASSDKDLNGVMIGGMTPVFNSVTNTYGIILPKAASLTQAVTFTKPTKATANFTSGNTHDFTNALTITVTAQDASTKLYTLTAVNGTADLAYVTATGNLGANDTKVYPDLLSKGYYVKLVNATGSDLTQFDASDLVILTEEVASGNTLALAMGGLIGVKPFLNFKAYMYSKAGWPTGAGSNGATDADAAIVSGYESHPLFTGVTLAGANASVFTAPAAKGLQGVTTPGSGTAIAYLTSTGNEAVACIIESKSIASAKYMMIGLANDSYSMVNASGLKLVENAIKYLLGNSVFDIDTKVQSVNLKGVMFDGQTIINSSNVELQVFDITGRKVISSNKNIYMSSQAKGIYIVKSNDKMMKIMLSK